jgi:dihydrofolate reductase
MTKSNNIMKRKLTVFNQISLDGYFCGENGDLSWAHQNSNDKEWNEFVGGNATGGGVLVFGRITYEMMAGYWPSEMAMNNDPVVAGQMNKLQKIVFSGTMKKAEWKNTLLINGNLAEEIKKLKSQSGDDIVILGSGSIVSQLTEAGLIDGFQIVVNPIILGNGRTMFEGVTKKPRLKLTDSRKFKNGNVVLTYN